MKVAYLCALAHLTVIEKPEGISGTIPREIMCSNLNCGCPAGLFDFEIDESVQASHVFYNKPDPKEIVTFEEQRYLRDGGLMFRQILENVPEEVKKEFLATKGITKLAVFLAKNIPPDKRSPDVIDTAIEHLKQYFGHIALMNQIKNGNNKN